MTSEQLEPYLMAGESTCIEFKQCGGNPSWDIFESFCAFLNRDGGDLFLGITDDGKIIGVPENACESIIKNLIKVMNDPNLLDPPFCVLPEVIDCSGRKVIRLHVPKSADVHRFKGVCYDRVFDADVKVRTTESITMMYLRKQNIFTERKVYQYVTMAELRTDLLPIVRRYAETKQANHPWGKLSDEELLKSAGLLRHDYANNVTGICLAGILLLGRDDVIRDILPAYKTDALLRRVDTDRYDDRLTVSTNLLESYTQLLQFGRKWLPDKFFLEDFLRISIREKILREAIGNMLMHREFTSAYCARFIIEKNQIVVDNANRSVHQGTITLQNLSPLSKNPLIARFFKEIGFADELGSGVRNLYKYVPLYSGRRPTLMDDDIFKLTIPLDDDFSPGVWNPAKGHESAEVEAIRREHLEMHILQMLRQDGYASRRKLAGSVRGGTEQKIRLCLERLQQSGKIQRIGPAHGGYWKVVGE